MNNSVFVLNITHISNLEESIVETHVFGEYSKAFEKFKEKESEWIEEQKKARSYGEDTNSEAFLNRFNTWLDNALTADICYEEVLYKRFQYDHGEEKIFSIRKYEVL